MEDEDNPKKVIEFINFLSNFYRYQSSLTGVETTDKLEQMEVGGNNIDELKQVATILCDKVAAQARSLHLQGKYTEDDYRDIAARVNSAFDTYPISDIIADLEGMVSGEGAWKQIYCNSKS